MSTVAFPKKQTVPYRLDGVETSAAYRLVDLLAQRYIFGVLLSSFTQIPWKFPKLDETTISNYWLLRGVAYSTAVKKVNESTSIIRRPGDRHVMQFDYLLTYLLTPYSTALLETLTGSQLIKKFPAFYGTRRFITVFTSARHLSLS